MLIAGCGGGEEARRELRLPSEGQGGRAPVELLFPCCPGDLSVSVVREGAPGLALLGEARQEGTRVLFEPRFPWEPGLTYEAFYDEGDHPLRARFTIPRLTFEETSVVAVYPSGDELPANLLKLYIQFSGPMSRGEAFGRLHLVDSERGEVDLPFLELDEELWDSTGTRFTLFFDPGRIKREVKPLLDLGAALEPGRTYTLRVDQDWQDAHGQGLASPFEKRFRVTAPDRIQPDPTRWTLRTPSAGTRAALEVAFEEPLDRALLERMLRIQDRDGRTVAGEALVAADEASWSWVPADPWFGGDYLLVVDGRLEDRSGNSVGKAFEVALDPAGTPDVEEAVELPFNLEREE